MRSVEGIWFKGRFCELWSGVYTHDTVAFFRGSLKDVSRTVVCGNAAAVIVLYED